MKDLAIAFSTCDKYSYLWQPWYYYFRQHWDIDLPMYFINEEEDCPYKEFKQIKVNMPGPGVWTERIRKSVEQIPHKHIFFLLDDLLFMENISELFIELYDVFKKIDADALRILMMPSAATANDTDIIIRDKPLRRLTPKSKYLISYIPNIYKKDVLLDCLGGRESIWDSEVKGSKRIRKRGYAIYDYMQRGWYINSVVLGNVTRLGKEKIEYAKSKENSPNSKSS